MNWLCKILVGIVSAGIILSACENQIIDTENVVDTQNSRIAKTNSVRDIIYHENADGTTLFGPYSYNGTSTIVKKQVGETYGITQSTSIYWNGTKSARFELHDTDSMVQSGTRTEIVFPMMTNLKRWYSYALYFDSANYKYDTKDEVIMQWHQGGGLTPALCFRTKKNKLYLRVMGNIWLDLGTLQKNSWHTYVLYVNHSSKSSGLIRIWKDGTQILNYPGKNMYAVGGSITKPSWKLGIYKSGWNDNSTSDTDVRILYYDDIRYGDEDATYTDMVPRL